MRALIVTTSKSLELRDIPSPQHGPFHALVKILACGICSTTDTELIRGTQPYHTQYPCLLGHEAIGEVIEIGGHVKNFKPGDWVTRPVGILPGTTCDGLTSAWGGFAEYGLVTDLQAMIEAGDYSMANDYTTLRQNVLPKGKEAGIEASVLSIALTETFNWSEKIDMKQKTVCINGTGIAGLSLVIWAKLSGAKNLIVLGRRAERLRLAQTLGADIVINSRECRALETVLQQTGGGVDIFLEATGVSNQMEIAIRSLKSGGTLGVYGVAPGDKYELDWRWLPIDIRITRHEPQEHLARKQVMDLIAAGKIPVKQLMTHQWPLEKFQQAFEAVGKGEVVKSMLTIQKNDFPDIASH